MKKVSLYLEFCIKLKEFDKWKGIFCGHGRKFDNVPIDYKMELHLLNSMGELVVIKHSATFSCDLNILRTRCVLAFPNLGYISFMNFDASKYT